MGRRAYVQVRHAEYGKTCLTDWVQDAAAAFLDEKRINICVSDDMRGAEDADHWEIEIPYKEVRGKGKESGFNYVTDYGRIQKVIDYLRKRPNSLDRFITEKDMKGRKMAESLADLLEEGLESAKKRKYSWINIDWF